MDMSVLVSFLTLESVGSTVLLFFLVKLIRSFCGRSLSVLTKGASTCFADLCLVLAVLFGFTLVKNLLAKSACSVFMSVFAAFLATASVEFFCCLDLGEVTTSRKKFYGVRKWWSLLTKIDF